jgi:hypothetical protein
MTTLSAALALRALALAIWFGGGLAMLFATRGIFAVAESRKQAGRFSGAALMRYQLLRGAAAVLLGGAAFLGARGVPTLLGLAAILLQLFSAPVDARLRALRDELGGSTEGLEPGDRRRKLFGALHGVSVLLLLAQVAVAGVGLALASVRS